MQLTHANNSGLPVAEYRGQRVITFAMIDRAHRRPKNAAQRNFNQNRNRFIEGEDFYLVPRAEKNEFRSLGIVVPNRGLIVMTETGYLMIVKSFTDDLSWQVQRELVRHYFRRPEDAPDLRAEMAALREDVSFLRGLLERKFLRKPNKPNRPLSEEERAQMRAMYLDGRGVVEIAEATGRSSAAVSWCVRCVKEELAREQEGGAS